MTLPPTAIVASLLALELGAVARGPAHGLRLVRRTVAIRDTLDRA
jgi:hypothetical protein